MRVRRNSSPSRRQPRTRGWNVVHRHDTYASPLRSATSVQTLSRALSRSRASPASGHERTDRRDGATQSHRLRRSYRIWRTISGMILLPCYRWHRRGCRPRRPSPYPAFTPHVEADRRIPDRHLRVQFHGRASSLHETFAQAGLSPVVALTARDADVHQDLREAWIRRGHRCQHGIRGTRGCRISSRSTRRTCSLCKQRGSDSVRDRFCGVTCTTSCMSSPLTSPKPRWIAPCGRRSSEPWIGCLATSGLPIL